jgi:hypothetical protein
MFLDEARTLAKINSPYIVHVRDFFREHCTAYIAMDKEKLWFRMGQSFYSLVLFDPVPLCIMQAQFPA